jgi:hypothetical protein
MTTILIHFLIEATTEDQIKTRIFTTSYHRTKDRLQNVFMVVCPVT